MRESEKRRKDIGKKRERITRGRRRRQKEGVDLRREEVGRTREKMRHGKMKKRSQGEREINGDDSPVPAKQTTATATMNSRVSV